MATTDATPIPVKNQAYRVTFPILDADGDLVTAATGLDSEVSKDAGTFTDCSAEATEIASGSGMYYLDLTATEMNAGTVAIVVKTTSSGAKTTPMVLYPNKAGGLAVNVTAWAGSATATNQIAIKTTLAKGTELTGFNDIAAGAAMTLTSAYDAAKTAASQTSVNTIDDFVDTEVAAIKVVTDKLDTALVLDGAVYQYTANALELGPAGGGGGGDASQATLLAVKAKTDALPTDPADASDIAASFATVNGTLATLSGYVDTEVAAILAAVDTEVAAIKSKTDNLPVDPADESNISANFATLSGKVDVIDDFLDTEIAAIKAVTDKLNTALVIDGAVYQYTANALELAPVGGGGGGDASQATLLAVKAKTDALPTDPADASDINASFAATDAMITTLAGYVDTEVAAIKSKTDQLTFTGGKVDANATFALLAADLTAIADAVLKRDWTGVSGEAAYSLLNAARMLRNKWDTTAGTLTVKKEDSTTTAWTRTLTTDPAAQPIIGAT